MQNHVLNRFNLWRVVKNGNVNIFQCFTEWIIPECFNYKNIQRILLN